MQFIIKSQIAYMLIDLSELLSDPECEISAGELLECLESRIISKADADEIRECLYS